MTNLQSLHLDEAAELLRALAHGVRLSLLRALIEGERSVGEVEQLTRVNQPGLSQQLGVLRKAGLVHTRKEAKQVFYRINQERLAEVSALLDAFAGTVAVARDEAPDRASPGGSAAMFARVAPRS